MITLEHIYWIMGLLAGGVAIVNVRDRATPKHYNNAMFWRLAPAALRERLSGHRHGARRKHRKARQGRG